MICCLQATIYYTQGWGGLPGWMRRCAQLGSTPRLDAWYKPRSAQLRSSPRLELYIHTTDSMAGNSLTTMPMIGWGGGLSGGERGCGRLAAAGWLVHLAGGAAAGISLLEPFGLRHRWQQRLLRPSGGQQAGWEGDGGW